MTKRKVAIFDLDYTLVKVNTAYEFVKFVSIQNHQRLRYYLTHLFYQNPFLLPHHRSALISLLTGYHQSTLKNLAQKFVKQIVTAKFRHQIKQMLEKYKKEGYECLIVSASFDFIVQPIAESLDVDYLASQLLFKNKRSQGKIKFDCFGQNKLSALAKKISLPEIDQEKSVFYSDSPDSDRPLFDFFPDSRLARKKEFFPGSYWYATREKNIYYFTYEFLLSYFLPVYGLSFLGTGLISANLFVRLAAPLIVWLGLISIYEIGYFLNDKWAAELEESPSYQLTAVEKEEAKKFILIRIVSFLIWLACLYLLTQNIKLTQFYLASIIFIFLVFWLHNHLRRLNLRLITYAVLNFSKVMIFGLFQVLGGQFPRHLLYFALIMTVYKSLMYARKKELIISQQEMAEFAYPKVLVVLAVSLLFIQLTSRPKIFLEYLAISIYIFLVLTSARLMKKLSTHRLKITGFA